MLKVAAGVSVPNGIVAMYALLLLVSSKAREPVGAVVKSGPVKVAAMV
jgi:hypothetical protein